jgi:hypothetical protein
LAVLGLSKHPISLVTVAIVLVLAIATQLLNVLVLRMLGQSLGMPTTLQQWFIVAPRCCSSPCCRSRSAAGACAKGRWSWPYTVSG